jgi:tRNA(Met) C34 N-acetyltransferase TmcA
MKDINLKFTDKLEENQLAQEINSIEEINNPEPVKEITPEYREELISNMIESNQAMGLYDDDPIITEEIKEEEPIEEITPTPEPVITEEQIKPKNTVRIMDGNFTF